MYKKHIYVLFIAVLITAYPIEGKKARRTRRPNNEDDTTPQPSVVSYSTFGFNDVGSYDGFVPTSPDYASYLSDNQESTTRLYAPAFPSAVDPTGFNNNFGSPMEGSSFGNSDDSVPQSSMIQYPQSSVNFFNTPSFDGNNGPNKNFNDANRQDEEDPSGLVYGTKLNSKNKVRNLNPFNQTEFNVYSSGPLANANDLASRFVMPGIPSTHEGKNPYGESGAHDQNFPNYAPNYPSSDVEEFVKPASSNPHNALKFPRVVDFTKIKQYYPTEVDNKYQVASYSSILNTQNENMFSHTNDDQNNNNNNQMNKYIQPTPTLKDVSSFNTQYRDDDSEKESINQNSYQNQDYRQNFISSAPKKPNYKLDYKDNFKNSKWNSGNYSNNEAQSTKMSMKGYEYSTDYSNTSFTYDYEPDKKPFSGNADELVPASSNIVDLTSYNFPDNDFSNFKKIPESKYPLDDDFGAHLSKDKYKNDEFINQFKNLYTTTPLNQWSNTFRTNEYPYKHRPKKPQYEENINSDVVHIPKRPTSSYRFNYGKIQESKPSEYPNKLRPFKSNKFEKPKDWNKEIFNTRFKSEEDLLGLRNHDTSNPSYIPSQRPSSNDLTDESDYKKLVEKWRQSYLKSKYKDAYRDYESYASESKPLHVPIPKPYPIEVPHPVIVPVPQPYPVRVPVPKPVAVPVVRELTVPIEKPIPYPVIKKVPYPVEKPVPVPVEKEVPVPVVKPYPVHIPHVRPVFHHSRPPREDFDSEADTEEDIDYLPRPESGKRLPPYKKRPRSSSTRTRPRRPTRTSYHDRNTRERRRWPTGNRSPDTRSRRPSTEFRHSPPYRYHEYESEGYDNEPNDYYYLHCKRTGNC